VSFAITTHPTAEWLAHRISEAFPWDSAPRYLIRDRDRSYGEVFQRRVKSMGSCSPSNHRGLLGIHVAAGSGRGAAATAMPPVIA